MRTNIKKERICEICGEKNKVIHSYKFNKTLCRKHYDHMYLYGRILNKTKFDKNDIEIKDNYAEIILTDIKANEIARAIIDIEDIERCKLYKWGYSRGWGYCKSKVNNKFIFLQNFILSTNGLIDHINKTPLDNRKENLRKANKSLNSHNTDIRKNNKSGITGVSWNKIIKKWRSYITIEGTKIELGNFLEKNNAIVARLKSENFYLKDFAPQKHLFEKYGIIKGGGLGD